MIVKLFKNSKVDGITRLGYWTSKEAQFAYFDGLANTKTFNVKTIKLGEPLKINDSLNNLLLYGYGYIDYGDGFRYFFSVGDLEFVTETLTEIHYTIDCYDTAIKQTNINLKRATITRYPEQLGNNRYPVKPIYNDYSQRFNPIRYGIAMMFTPKNGDKVYCGLFVNKPNQLANAQFLGEVCSGEWLKNLNYAVQLVDSSFELLASDIYVLNAVPIFGDLNTSFYKQKLPDIPIGDYAPYYHTTNAEFWVSDYAKYGTNKIPIRNYGKSYWDSPSEENKLESHYAIRDMRGNVVFTADDECQYTIDAMDIVFSSTSIDLLLSFKRNATENLYITIPSEIVDLYSDTWAEYRYRQRQYDIELRNMHLEQQFVAGIASTGTGVLSGAMMGGMAGLGAGAGAGLSIATGAISTVGNYVIGSYYGNREQNIIDRQVKASSDTLKQRGNNVSFFALLNLCGPCIETYDTTSLMEYENDYETGGYYCNFPVASFSSYLKKGPITADVEILGDIPVAWKEQIHDRLMRGVVFE